MEEPHRPHRYLIASLILLLLVIGFGYLQITRNIFTSCDLQAFRLIQPLHGSIFNATMRIVTRLGEEEYLTPIIACIYWAGYPVQSIALTAMLLFGGSLNDHFKNLFSLHRPLPSETQILAGASGYGYPSGHTESATVLSGFAYLNVSTYRALCLLPAVLVGFSRIFLGVHYLSDVIGGLAVGTAVVLVGHTAHGVYQRWIELRQTRLQSISLRLFLCLLLPALYLLFAWENAIGIRGAGSLTGLLVGYNLMPHGWRAKSRIRLITAWVIGLMILAIVRTGLKYILPEGSVFVFIRFLVVGLCLALSPAAFVKTHLLIAVDKKALNSQRYL